MKNISYAVIVLSVLVAAIISTPSCKQTPAVKQPEVSVDEAIVQVWSYPAALGESRTLLSFGVVVGDGSQVLTLINYEDYTPGNLQVVTQGHGKYSASVKAVDPRTSMTLLKLEGATGLPAAAVSNISIPDYGQEVLIWGWIGPDYTTFKSSPAVIIADRAPRPLFFTADYNIGNTAVVHHPGAVVTDGKGNILGLETRFHIRLAAILGYPGMMPPIASISSAMELLSSNAAQHAWANGPALSIIADSAHMTGYFAGVLPSPSDYGKMTTALQDLLGKLGDPVATDDLHLNGNPAIWNRTLDGTMLVVVYPYPVDIKSISGEALDQAKWVGIEWARSEGKPNRLVYGSTAYTIDGGFVLLGDTTDLQQSVPAPGTPALAGTK